MSMWRGANNPWRGGRERTGKGRGGGKGASGGASGGGGWGSPPEGGDGVQGDGGGAGQVDIDTWVYEENIFGGKKFGPGNGRSDLGPTLYGDAAEEAARRDGRFGV